MKKFEIDSNDFINIFNFNKNIVNISKDNNNLSLLFTIFYPNFPEININKESYAKSIFSLLNKDLINNDKNNENNENLNYSFNNQINEQSKKIYDYYNNLLNISNNKTSLKKKKKIIEIPDRKNYSYKKSLSPNHFNNSINNNNSLNKENENNLKKKSNFYRSTKKNNSTKKKLTNNISNDNSPKLNNNEKFNIQNQKQKIKNIFIKNKINKENFSADKKKNNKMVIKNIIKSYSPDNNKLFKKENERKYKNKNKYFKIIEHKIDFDSIIRHNDLIMIDKLKKIIKLNKSQLNNRNNSPLKQYINHSYNINNNYNLSKNNNISNNNDNNINNSKVINNINKI